MEQYKKKYNTGIVSTPNTDTAPVGKRNHNFSKEGTKENKYIPLNVFHLNIRSIRNKVGDFEAYMQAKNHDYDVLCFSEHFLAKDEIESFCLNGYYTAAFYARSLHMHGGTIIFCKSNIEYKPKNDLGLLSIEMNCELSAVELNKLNIIIITVYRPPDGDFNVFLGAMTTLLDKISNMDKYIIINGDFNIHFNKNCTNKHTFLNLVNSYGFVQMIYENTRIDACIDNIFINFCDNLNCITNVYDPLLSDHCALDISVDISPLKSRSSRISQVIYRPVTSQGKLKMYYLLETETWEFINSNLDIDNKVSCFLQKILHLRNIAFPEAKKKMNLNHKNQIQWFNNDIRDMRENLRFLTDLLKNFRTPRMAETVKNYRYKYRLAINKAKQKANTDFIEKADNKVRAAWEVINSNRRTNSSVEDVSIHANDFNSFFINVANNALSNLREPNLSFEEYLEQSNLNITNLSFSFREVTYNEVRDAINELKNKHSKDFYDLDIMLIKSLKDMLITPLTKLFNQCIREGVYPSCFKISKIIPIFKKGNQTDLGNYRPIALIPVISKILELLLKQQLYDYLEQNNLLIESQYGFRKEKSTVGAINKLCETVLRGFEDGDFVGSTFCDLSKAFDCVSHEILLKKLEYYGVRDVSLKLLSVYLTGRTQVTYYGGTFSEEEKIAHGVPQGSILGPLLFLIYINDIFSSLTDSALVLYADDTNFTHCDAVFEHLKSRMDASVSSVEDWFSASQLSLNVNKTEQIIFSLRKNDKIDNPESTKFLGVLLDPTLKFDRHVDYICNKLSKNIFLLKNLIKTVSQHVCVMTFHAVIQSVLSYAIITWGHSSHANRVFKLQRRAVRVIAKLEYQTDARKAYTDLKIMTLPCRYIFECIIYTKNNVDQYNTARNIHNHNTRQKDDLRVEFLRLSKSWNATLYLAPTFYNKLPISVKSLEGNKFKKVIKKLLIKKAYYSYEEFLDDCFTSEDF